MANQHLNEQPAALRTLRPDAPAELERLVSRLMATDPAQRSASAEVWAAFKEIDDRRPALRLHPAQPRRSYAHDIDVTPTEAADRAIAGCPWLRRVARPADADMRLLSSRFSLLVFTIGHLSNIHCPPLSEMIH
ncbi:hypothetical protein AB0N50_34110 [Streptomyces pharetrae]|uniref:hypothetical protein n=1 Tax=Streptomyces pharetrae TaxID=291370 RepID=UPI003460D08E